MIESKVTITLTSFLVSALDNITYIKPHHTFMSSNSFSGQTPLPSCTDLKSSLHWEDNSALMHIAHTKPTSSQSKAVMSGIWASLAFVL